MPSAENVKISLRLTKEELLEIDHRAAALNKSRTQFMRDCALSDSIQNKEEALTTAKRLITIRQKLDRICNEELKEQVGKELVDLWQFLK